MQAYKAGLQAGVNKARTDAHHKTTKDLGINVLLKHDTRITGFGELALQLGTLRCRQGLRADDLSENLTPTGGSHGGKRRQNLTKTGKSAIVSDHAHEINDQIAKALLPDDSKNCLAGVSDIKTRVLKDGRELRAFIDQSGESVSLGQDLVELPLVSGKLIKRGRIPPGEATCPHRGLSSGSGTCYGSGHCRLFPSAFPRGIGMRGPGPVSHPTRKAHPVAFVIVAASSMVTIGAQQTR